MYEGRVTYGNLENKINTLYWLVENSIHKKITMQTIDKRAVTKRCRRLVTSTSLALELLRKSVKHSSWKKLSYCFKF